MEKVDLVSSNSNRLNRLSSPQCDHDPTETSLSNGLRIPPQLMLQMLPTDRVTLKSEMIKKHPGPLFCWGIPYLHRSTHRWIRVAGFLMFASLAVEVPKVALAMSRMAVAVSTGLLPASVVCQFVGYLSLRVASYWILIVYTLAQACLIIFDVVLMTAMGTALYREEVSLSDQPATYFVITFFSCVFIVLCVIVIGRVYVLVRRDVAELSIRIPVERLDGSIDPQPFLLWYFGLPPPESAHQEKIPQNPTITKAATDVPIEIEQRK